MNQSFPNQFQSFTHAMQVSQKLIEFKQVFFEHFMYPAPSKLTFMQISQIIQKLKQTSQNDRITQEVFIPVFLQQFNQMNDNDIRHLFCMHQIASNTQNDQADIRSLGLFLYLQSVQLYNRQSISLESKVKDFNGVTESRFQEAFKQTGFSPLNSPRAKTMRLSGHLNECQSILHFFKQNIRQILKIISLNFDVDDEKAIVTDKQFNLLSMIFYTEKQSLSSLVFERNTRMLLPVLAEWIIKNLGYNENEIFTLSGFTKSVTIKLNKSIQNSHLRIVQCEDSQLFIDQPLQTLSISQCNNCVIFVSGVSQVTSISLCDRVTICLVSNILRIQNTIDSTFHYFGINPAVLHGDCRNITLGPHNGNTLRLIERVREVNVPLNRKNSEIFQKPLILQCNQNIDYNIITPEDLSILSLPEESFSALSYALIEESGFDVERIGRELTEKKILSQPLILDRIFIPPLAPMEYQKSIFQRYKLFAELQSKIKLSCLKDEDGKLLEQAIQGNFREWLVTTGAIKPITDLVKLMDDQN